MSYALPLGYEEALRRLASIDNKLDHLINKQERVMATLADIQTAVGAEKTVEDSVVALLQTLSADLQAAIASNSPAAMQAVVDMINTNAAAMATAVAANQPPAPTPTPAPTPGP